VQNVFAGVKTIFRFSANNRKIATDPTAGITYKAKRDPKKRRLPFTFDEAKLILTAARSAGPEIFFPNLIASLSGARLAEVVEAHTDDIEMIDGRWCLHIRDTLLHRSAAGRSQPPAPTVHVRRTYSGRPSSSMRLSEATAMATSVICRPPVRERSTSPITRL
jgi:integrase